MEKTKNKEKVAFEPIHKVTVSHMLVFKHSEYFFSFTM